MFTTPGRIRVAAVAGALVVALIAGTALGRHVLAGGTASPAAHSGTADGPAVAVTARGPGRSPSEAAAAPGLHPVGQPAEDPTSAPGSGALPPVPTFPIAPQIVRTATLDLHVGTGGVGSTVAGIAALASADGGYVESSAMSGGTARTSPVTGSIVVHVLDDDFESAIAQISAHGKVTGQQIQGKDVTDEVAANAASLQVLQEQANLLQGKLAQATDINTFLQVQDQLFPVEQQLQQLQNQQAVLQSSAALATITVNMAAPGAPAASTPAPRPDAATVAWRSLRHNSLAVLDGLAVGAGWALPVLALLLAAGVLVARILRWRRRPLGGVA